MSNLFRFPKYFFFILIPALTVISTVILQPWIQPCFLFDDPIEAANYLLKYQYHHPEIGPMEFYWFAGMVTYLCAFLMFSSGVACIFTAIALFSKHSGNETPRLFFNSGCLSLLLAYDEFFMLHERFPRIVFEGEKILLALYLLYLCWILWRFRNVFLTFQLGPFACSCICLAASQYVDFHHGFSRLLEGLSLPWWQGNQAICVLEEGLKYLGIVSWFAFFTYQSWAAIKNRLLPANQGDSRLDHGATPGAP